jgi:hypothetical protein
MYYAERGSQSSRGLSKRSECYFGFALQQFLELASDVVGTERELGYTQWFLVSWLSF